MPEHASQGSVEKEIQKYIELVRKRRLISQVPKKIEPCWRKQDAWQKHVPLPIPPHVSKEQSQLKRSSAKENPPRLGLAGPSSSSQSGFKK